MVEPFFEKLRHGGDAAAQKTGEKKQGHQHQRDRGDHLPCHRDETVAVGGAV